MRIPLSSTTKTSDADRLQSSSWYVSLVEFLVKAGFAIGHFIIFRKTRDDAKNSLARGLGGAITDEIENIL